MSSINRKGNADTGYVVDILMPTYNHEAFIAKAIESVLAQETTFPFRLLIGDDCSTDDTGRICREFAENNKAEIVYITYDTNVGMASNYKQLFDHSDSKYISILEGDDYWVDPGKLQKQYEILEKSPDIGLVHTNFYALYANGKKKKGHLGISADQLSGSVIGPTQTVSISINPLTTMFRAELARANTDFDFIIANYLLTVDIFLWAEICRRSRVHFLDEITGVYRIHSSSLTGNRNIDAVERFSNTSLMMVNYLMEKYETQEDTKSAFISRNRIDLIYENVLSGRKSRARELLKEVEVKSSLKDAVICFSVKYRISAITVRIIHLYYKLGSSVKQLLYRILNK